MIRLLHKRTLQTQMRFRRYSSRPEVRGPEAEVRVFSGPVVHVQRCRFQAHVAFAASDAHVDAVVAAAKAAKGAKSASHCIVGARFSINGSNTSDSGSKSTSNSISNSNSTRSIKRDGGEAGGGVCIVAAIERANATNVAAVVLRWYGGAPLGPLRFRVITKAVHDAISAANLTGRDSQSIAELQSPKKKK
ncbi:hypothetical protein HK100_002763 [Physocladia obscura]|uniref:Impact N-terminal domain-containing protein n=1 Tax=Physocladia obscura TaxID=109957 RepID=A0AAD5SVW8_9FUNG|nr:hypothetical protein HK100_002763 [Physocladia obscura]